MILRLLGTGNAGGVPLYGCDCVACERARITTDRQRGPCCAVLEAGGTRLLIDAGLEHLGRAFPCGELDSILLTHFHMDHVQGLFPIRWGDCPLPVIGPDDPNGCDDLLIHSGRLDFSRKAQPFEPFEVGAVSVTPLPLTHSRPTLGYLLTHRQKSIAYLTDTIGLPPETAAWLSEHTPDLLVLDCSFPPQDTRPRNHNDLNAALDIVTGIQPPRTLLTHIGHRFDAWLIEHQATLPKGVEVARDGLSIEFY